jgi:hypothetical protein
MQKNGAARGIRQNCGAKVSAQVTPENFFFKKLFVNVTFARSPSVGVQFGTIVLVGLAGLLCLPPSPICARLCSYPACLPVVV